MNLIEEGLAVGIPAPTEDALRSVRPSRVHDVWARGKDFYEADVLAATAIGEAFPLQQTAVDITREYGAWSVHCLAERGFTQFLDLGSGFPPSRRQDVPAILSLSTHEIAHRVQPEARVVYVDVDHDVIAHSRVLYVGRTSGPEPAAVLADITHMRSLIGRLTSGRLLDFASPVAVLLHDVLPWIEDGPVQELMADLRDLLPADSAVSVSHATARLRAPGVRRVPTVYRAHGIAYRQRRLSTLRPLFGAWPDLRGGARVALAPAARYHREHSRYQDPVHLSSAYAGIAVKPPRIARTRTEGPSQ
ncbi:SAM-dependent methyltransferase [Streptomyces sp. NPDC001502]|uniref:SAM-dependent methyltransferase n=1 Tax=Streptomyces sp. NPDC001502 TaxID=3364578 RepID=UPI0036BDF433